MNNNQNKVDKLIYLFSKIPGLGPRSAKRAVLHLLRNKDNFMFPLANLLSQVGSSTQICITCGNVDEEEICSICRNKSRDHSIICVVESISDLWAIERSEVYNGVYHVLGGTLSAIENRGPEQLNIENLIARSNQKEVKEVIIATNATLEGQTTAFYLSEKIINPGAKISRLAFGIPIGGELDYLDEGTLSAALSSRQEFETN